jgi:hypothetical protein
MSKEKNEVLSTAADLLFLSGTRARVFLGRTRRSNETRGPQTKGSRSRVAPSSSVRLCRSPEDWRHLHINHASDKAATRCPHRRTSSVTSSGPFSLGSYRALSQTIESFPKAAAVNTSPSFELGQTASRFVAARFFPQMVQYWIAARSPHRKDNYVVGSLEAETPKLIRNLPQLGTTAWPSSKLPLAVTRML